MSSYKLIFVYDEIYADEEYSEDDIEALLDEYSSADTTELTLDDKLDILEYDDAFDTRKFLKATIESFYSYTYNRRYAVVSDSWGNCIFEMDYN